MRLLRVASAVLSAAALAPAAPAQPASPEITPSAPRGTAVYAELGGNALFYSVNVEPRLAPRLAVRVGAAYLEGGVLLPALALVTLTEPGPGLSAEAGLGGVVAVGGGEVELLPSGLLGLRYQTRGGALFRLSFTPVYFPDGLFGDSGDGFVAPWGGVSAGYAF